ncbi:MAG: hypothetical protein KDA45_00785 [Planctomycetales bacterium]|nr:hypothetical protein [Planctomycetales bacterium]
MNDRAIDWEHVLGPILSRGEQGLGAGVCAAEIPALERATFAHARRAVRPRPGLDDDELPFPTTVVPWFTGGRFLLPDGRGEAAVRPGAFLQHAAGDYYIQDAGSMLALALCDVSPGQWVCDTCAAPGGKSSALLEALDGSGLLLSNEVIASRFTALPWALARAGYGNYLLTQMEVDRLQERCGPRFDRVLVDAPCSGQTMIARGKQSLAAFSRPQIEHSSARQLRILRAAAGLVKPGGRLVYSTCSYSFAENEQVVLAFLSECGGWQARSVPGLERWGSPAAAGCYRLWPHRDGCAGAFAAALQRVEDEPSLSLFAQARARRRADSKHWQPRQPGREVSDWLIEREPGQWWQYRNQLHRLSAEIPVEWIPQAAGGACIAENKISRWEPCFGGAMLANSLCTAPQRLELSDDEASRYVAGEALRCAAPYRDWCLASWRGRPLSWGKLTQKTLKNHFPKSLRQRQLIWHR